MAENMGCDDCPLFEWFEGGINAGWCGVYRRPVEECGEVCADKRMVESKTKETLIISKK